MRLWGGHHSLELVRWDTWSAGSLFVAWKIPAVSGWGGWRRGRRRRRSRRHEGPDYQSETQLWGMSPNWIYDVYECRNMWGFTVFGYIVLIKTYQQLVFFWKRWKLNTCTGFRLVVLLKWDVLTKEIGAPSKKKMCKKGSDVATGKDRKLEPGEIPISRFDTNGLWKLDVNQKWFPGWKGNSGWEDGHFCYLNVKFRGECTL